MLKKLCKRLWWYMLKGCHYYDLGRLAELLKSNAKGSYPEIPPLIFFFFYHTTSDTKRVVVFSHISQFANQPDTNQHGILQFSSNLTVKFPEGAQTS